MSISSAGKVASFAYNPTPMGFGMGLAGMALGGKGGSKTHVPGYVNGQYTLDGKPYENANAFQVKGADKSYNFVPMLERTYDHPKTDFYGRPWRPEDPFDPKNLMARKSTNDLKGKMLDIASGDSVAQNKINNLMSNYQLANVETGKDRGLSNVRGDPFLPMMIAYSQKNGIPAAQKNQALATALATPSAQYQAPNIQYQAPQGQYK